MDFDTSEYLADFLAETSEHLAASEELLLEAERLVATGEAWGPDLINPLFRALHTIKGNAGLMGFEAFAAISHEMEHLLDEVRRKARMLSASELVVVIDTLDALKRLHAHIERHGEETGADESASLAAIAQVAAGAGAPEPQPSQPAPVATATATADFPSLADLVAVAELSIPPPSPAPATAQEFVPAAHEAAPTPAAAGVEERASSIRVETTRLDLLVELVGEMLIHHTQLATMRAELAEVLEERTDLEASRVRLTGIMASFEEAMRSLGRVGEDLQSCTMKVRMVQVGALFNRFPRIVRDVARDCGKAAKLELDGVDTELDKNLIEQLADPLVHLMRNAVDHGLETQEARQLSGKPLEGTITLSARQAGHHIVVEVRDDGRGIDLTRVRAKGRALRLIEEGGDVSDHEALQMIFRPGFSTAERVTHLSGRGVGLDVVQQNISRLGGTIQVQSEPGRGTCFTVKLPLTLAIAKALLVKAAGSIFAVPLAAVDETLRVPVEEIRTVRGREVVQIRGEVLNIYRLRGLFSMEPLPGPERYLPMVVVGDGARKMALVVDALVGQQDVVIKSLGEYLGAVPGVGGATILGDGRVALILDVPTLLARGPGQAALPA